MWSNMFIDTNDSVQWGYCDLKDYLHNRGLIQSGNTQSNELFRITHLLTQWTPIEFRGYMPTATGTGRVTTL